MPDDTTAAVRGQRLPRSERRAQLLDAALGVFVENGYHAAAMDDIAARAGVSKPVLYQHFPGKLELYLALIDQHTGELEQLVRDALALEDNKARINTMTRAYFDFVGQEGAAFRLIFESDLANEPEVRKRLDQIDLTCAEAMAEIITSETSMEQEEAVLVGVAFVGHGADRRPALADPRGDAVRGHRGPRHRGAHPPWFRRLPVRALHGRQAQGIREHHCWLR